MHPVEAHRSFVLLWRWPFLGHRVRFKVFEPSYESNAFKRFCSLSTATSVIKPSPTKMPVTNGCSKVNFGPGLMAHFLLSAPIRKLTYKHWEISGFFELQHSFSIFFLKRFVFIFKQKNLLSQTANDFVYALNYFVDAQIVQSLNFTLPISETHQQVPVSVNSKSKLEFKVRRRNRRSLNQNWTKTEFKLNQAKAIRDVRPIA